MGYHTASRGQCYNGYSADSQEHSHDHQSPAQGLHVQGQPWKGNRKASYETPHLTQNYTSLPTPTLHPGTSSMVTLAQDT